LALLRLREKNKNTKKDLYYDIFMYFCK